MSCCLRVLFLLALCATTATATPHVRVPGHEIPLALDMDGRITLPVRVNGAGPFRFRLDTGASRTVVTTRLCRRLGLSATGSSRTVTQTGTATQAAVRLAAVLLADGLTVSDVTAVVVADGALGSGNAVVGLLGQDVLSRWPYTIDYERGRLTVGAMPGAPRGPSARVPLSWASGGLVASIDAGGDGLRLVPDSGADRTVLFQSDRAVLPPLTLLDTVRVRSVTGESLARRVRVHGLHVGGMRVADHEGLLLDRGPDGTVMGDGLLPLHLFARVSFDITGGFMLLEARR